MIVWRTPVTDRAQADIDNKTDKAFMNADDFNRIEGNIDYLSIASYYNGNDIKRILPKNWCMTSILTTADIKRICQNIKRIAQSCPVTPKIDGDNLLESLLANPSKKLFFKDINYAEEMLFKICELLGAGQPFNTWGDLKACTYGDFVDSSYIYRDLQTIPLM